MMVMLTFLLKAFYYNLIWVLLVCAYFRCLVPLEYFTWFEGVLSVPILYARFIGLPSLVMFGIMKRIIPDFNVGETVVLSAAMIVLCIVYYSVILFGLNVSIQDFLIYTYCALAGMTCLIYMLLRPRLSLNTSRTIGALFDSNKGRIWISLMLLFFMGVAILRDMY